MLLLISYDEDFELSAVDSGQTKGISQRMKRDASSPSLDSFVSFRVSYVVTHYDHYAQEEEDT